LPGAIGAAVAAPGKQVICIDGDGGIQLNIQELQTIFHYQLPIKIFILNNHSMGIMKQFHDNYFGGQYDAVTPESGYSMPDFCKVAQAYGITAFSVKKPEDIKRSIQYALHYKGPIVCDVWINENQQLLPRLEFGRPLEDMRPYLSDNELNNNMIVATRPRIKGKRGWQKV